MKQIHVEDLEEKEEARISKQDARMKKNGMKYKSVVWVHSGIEGDDYKIEFYFREKPSKEFIKKMALRGATVMLNDITINLLKESEDSNVPQHQ